MILRLIFIIILLCYQKILLRVEVVLFIPWVWKLEPLMTDSKKFKHKNLALTWCIRHHRIPSQLGTRKQ